MKDGAAEVSVNEMLCPAARYRPDLLLRQHSMPASLHTHSTTSSDVDSYRVYRGPFAGASQGNSTHLYLSESPAPESITCTE